MLGGETRTTLGVHAKPRDSVIYLPLATLFSLCGLVLAAILFLNDGQFTYTGDDPYIHLALAENIARGHYGVNLAEYSAPSSSVLWPVLLAPFAPLRVDDLVPLCINLLCTTITVLLSDRIFCLLTESARDPGLGLLPQRRVRSRSPGIGLAARLRPRGPENLLRADRRARAP